MANISTAKEQSQPPDVIARHRKRIIVTRRGKRVAAVVPIQDVQALEEIEDREDVEDAEKALAEPGKSIPLSQIKKELGL